MLLFIYTLSVFNKISNSSTFCRSIAIFTFLWQKVFTMFIPASFQIFEKCTEHEYNLWGTRNISINSVVLLVFTFDCFSMNVLAKSRIEKQNQICAWMVWYVHLWHVHSSVLPIMLSLQLLHLKTLLK